MASTYSTNLALELIGTGDQAGTWGNTTNTNLGTLIEQAISGYVTQAVSTGTDTTITIPNGSTGVARNMYIELTGTGGTNTNLIVPANKKLYFIFNNSTGAVTVKVSGQTGVSVPAGKKMVLVSNGTDIVNGLNYIADFGTNSFTVTNLTATSASITTLTSTSATITNLTSTSLTLSNNPVLSGGTANGVLYLNGSKVATSGSALVFDGTNLGIGTSSPAVKLDVQTASAVGGITLTATTGTNGAAINCVNTGGSSYFGRNNSSGGAFGGAAYATVVYGGGAYPMSFYTNDTERMRLDSSGNLGLGVTPSAWLTAGNLDLSGGNIFSSSGTTLGSNAYYDVAWKYKNNGAASYYAQVAGAYHAWFTAPSGTAGNTITFTQAMTLDASGQLGIGTTSPGALLHVYTGTQESVRFARNSTNSSAYVTFYANNSSSAQVQYAGILGDVASSTAGSHGGNLLFYTTGSGTSAERARITSGGDFDVGTTANDGWKIHASATADQIRWSYDRNSYSAIFGFATHRGDSGGVEIGNINSSSDRSICFSNGTSYAGRTERARITSGGNLLVGKTADDTTTVGAQITAGGIINSAGTTDFFNAYSTSAAAYRFYVTNGGTIFATNTTISAISDQRLKENVRYLDVGLDAIMALKPRKFDWKEGKGKDIKNDRGFIAQEFEQVFPDLIDEWKDPAPEGEEPYKSVRQDLIPVLVKAIQELKAELDAAKVKIAALEAK